jgi:hypothetical protein
MAIPLVTYSGFLKQLDRDTLNSAQRLVLDQAFPQFWPGNPDSPENRAQTNAMLNRGIDYVFQDMDSPRRFSGCWSLPKRRYFALCHDDDGDDRNTLVNELSAYLDPMRAGLLLFADLGVPEGRAWLTQVLGPQLPSHALVVVLIGKPDGISPVIDGLQELGAIEVASNKQRQDRCMIAIQLPYRVQWQEIAGVFDLRLTRCQKYVVDEFFKKETKQLTKRDRHGVERFIETLPTLMNPALGGGAPSGDDGAILQALASFLRAEGAQALIFPSARSDASAVTHRGQLKDWRGWCLVDYRGAREPLVSGTVDFSSGWHVQFPVGARIRHAPDSDEYAGSFEILGITKWVRDRIGERETAFLASCSRTS